jgi:alpha-tubulin suppressor-like RCC1 family protein
MRVWGKSLLVLVPLALGSLSLVGCVADPGPIMVGAVAQHGSARVTWLPPVASPVPVVAYVVTPYVDHVAQTPTRFNSTATTQTVGGLINGRTYTFTVSAINAVGSETASSDESNPIAPQGPQIGAGDSHTCAVVAGGAVDCWGYNIVGQLGNGTTTNSSTPVPVSGLTGATAITAGNAHTCALMTDTTVRCWGANNRGQLGNGTTTGSTTPVPVSGLTGVTDVDAGHDSACAVVAGGGVYCWGYNFYGQLGNGTTTNSSTPVAVSGITDAVAVTAGFNHSCAVRSSGSIACWGSNDARQLGNGTNAPSSSTPVALPDVTGASAVAAGDPFTCALVSGGSAKCWGIGANGELGYGIYVNFHPAAGDVFGITGATEIAAGDDHTCVIVSGGAAKCWGNNQEGQLGNGTTKNCDPSEGVYQCGPPAPVSVLGLTDLTSIAGGHNHTCALAVNGAGYCWGANGAGKLGNGTITASPSPVPVSWP